MVYVKCQTPDCFVENGRDGRDTLRNAAVHVAKTGHTVKLTGTPASIVHDETLVLTREPK